MRLITRSDFDGLACGAVLKELGVIDHWKFVHPKDMQDGLVEITDQDVLANVPYVEGCGMWFDHHSSETARLLEAGVQYKGMSRLEDSAARVIFEYYDGKNKLPQMETMMKAVDKVDSGKMTADEILNPEGWVLLGFIMDPRTVLGRVRDFTISNYQLMELLIDECAKSDIDTILALPDVQERVKLYFEQDALFKEMVKKHTWVDGNVIVTDLRGVETIYTGNRFLVYSLYPEQNVSCWVVDGRGKLNCPIAIGYSILNRTCNADVGALCLKYGGGGHKQVGTCQVDYDKYETVIKEIVAALKV